MPLLGKIDSLEKLIPHIPFKMTFLEGKKMMVKGPGNVKDKGGALQLTLAANPSKRLAQFLDAHMLEKDLGMPKRTMQERSGIFQWQAPNLTTVDLQLGEGFNPLLSHKTI